MKLLEALTKFDAKSWALRLDSWVNTVTGFGTRQDKSTYGSIEPSRRLSDIELSAMYHGDDMAARMVDIVPQEILREGFTITTGSQGLDAALKTKHDRLNVREKLTDTIRWARLYGGAALLLGADDGRDSTLPLIPERVESLNYLHVIDRRLLWPVDYYLDATHPKFGQPKTYSVMSVGGPATYTATVHESRLVIFRGAPTGIYERAQWGSWDLSVLQRPYEILRQFNTGWKAVELMLTDGNQAVLKMSGLSELIASNDLTLLRTRLEANELHRSVVRALVVDADGNESFERQGVSFSDIPATLEKFMLRLSAAVQIPVTILMGQSPAGMSATGDSDFRWFYDRIRSQQTNELEPRIRRIVDVMLRTREFGGGGFRKPEHVELTFPPLWKLTPAEEAARRLSLAQTDAAYIQAQVITPEEVALSRFTPRGFGEELTLTDEARAARERVLLEDLDSMKGGASEDNGDGGDSGQGGELRTDGGDFKESDHPRDGDGKFGSGGGAGGETPWHSTKRPGEGKIVESKEKFSEGSMKVAKLLADEGNTVEKVPQKPKNRTQADGRIPDALVNGKPVEFKGAQSGKSIASALGNAVRGGIQAKDVVIDARGTDATEEHAVAAVAKLRHYGRLDGLDHVRIVGNSFDRTFGKDELS